MNSNNNYTNKGNLVGVIQYHTKWDETQAHPFLYNGNKMYDTVLCQQEKA